MSRVACQECQSIAGIHKKWCSKAYPKACKECGAVPVNGRCQCEPCRPGS